MSESTPARPARHAPRRRRSARRKTAELREFLAAGEGGEAEQEADPEFKRRLREELWELLQSRLRRGGGSD